MNIVMAIIVATIMYAGYLQYKREQTPGYAEHALHKQKMFAKRLAKANDSMYWKPTKNPETGKMEITPACSKVGCYKCKERADALAYNG